MKRCFLFTLSFTPFQSSTIPLFFIRLIMVHSHAFFLLKYSHFILPHFSLLFIIIWVLKLAQFEWLSHFQPFFVVRYIVFFFTHCLKTIHFLHLRLVFALPIFLQMIHFDLIFSFLLHLKMMMDFLNCFLFSP